MGFWVTTKEGNRIHINGDREMAQETLDVICRVFDGAIAQAMKVQNLEITEDNIDDSDLLLGVCDDDND